MSSSVDENILESARRFKQHLPTIQAKAPFFEGDWQFIEELKVLMGKERSANHIREQINPLIYNGETEPNKQQRLNLEMLIADAAYTLQTQDNLSGIDLRQIVQRNRSRTWSLREWDIPPHDPLEFAIRYKCQNYDGTWNTEVEYRRRKESLEKGFEVAGWFMQLFFDHADKQHLLALAYAEMRPLIDTVTQALQAAALAKDNVKQKYNENELYLLIPVESVCGYVVHNFPVNVE